MNSILEGGKLPTSLHSLRTAYRYAIEAGDESMVQEVDAYAFGKIGLNLVEVSWIYLTAKDRENSRKEEENNGEDI
jgi:hypothetical protein